MYHHRHHQYQHCYQFRQRQYHPTQYYLEGTDRYHQYLDRYHRCHLLLMCLCNQLPLYLAYHLHLYQHLHTHPLGKHRLRQESDRYRRLYLRCLQYRLHHCQSTHSHHQGIHPQCLRNYHRHDLNQVRHKLDLNQYLLECL